MGIADEQFSILRVSQKTGKKKHILNQELEKRQFLHFYNLSSLLKISFTACCVTSRPIAAIDSVKGIFLGQT